jgi:hypothetical protein
MPAQERETRLTRVRADVAGIHFAATSDVIARLDRAIQYAAAYPLKHWRLWNWMPRLKRGMTAEVIARAPRAPR